MARSARGNARHEQVCRAFRVLGLVALRAERPALRILFVLSDLVIEVARWQIALEQINRPDAIE